MLSEVDKSYLAGIMDGEGTITVWKSDRYDHRVLCVAVVMTKRHAVDMLHVEYGGCLKLYASKKPEWADKWRWQVKSRKAQRVLEELLPYLRVKRTQALLGVALASSFTHIGGRCTPEQRELQRSLHEQIQVLNRTGQCTK